MEPYLKTYSLTKKYKDVTAVDGVSLTIHRGDIYGLIGRNGAGKTTLMRMLLDMTAPTSGGYEYYPMENTPDFRKKIGAFIENPAIYKNCTAYENMKRYAMLFGGNDTDIRQILELVGLDHVQHKKAGKFSLGMKQRLGIGIALLGNPDFMILDEPVNGLDPTGIIEIRNLILRLNRERNTTFLISSHLLDELAKIATRFAMIDSGKLVEEISAEDLQERCKKRLDIYVDDVSVAYGVLSQVIDQTEMMVSEGVITLFSHMQESARFNKLLCDKGVMVSRLEIHNETLEQYFMGKVGLL